MPPKRTFIKRGQKLELDLTPSERKSILENVTLLPPEYKAMLKKIHPEQPLLLTLDDLEDFSGYVAAESSHTTNNKLRKVLDSAFEKMTVLLETFTDEKPPVKKTTKKAIAAERQEAERLKAISDQSAFIATWAAGVLNAAEQKRAKNRILETFIPGDLERVVLTTLDDVPPGVCKRLAVGKDEFTLAEVGGMLMAVAAEICVATVQQQVGMLMVARSLMTAMQDWVGEVMVDDMADTLTPRSRRSKTSKNKARPKKKLDNPKPSIKPQTSIYQFKITLLGTKPKIWRRIQIRDDSLDALHWMIQGAMGWTNSHMHEFHVNGTVYGPPEFYDPVDEYAPVDSTRTLISSIVDHGSGRPVFLYRYDLGDGWKHEVRLEKVVPPGTKGSYPVCIDGERACPPEDCGGPEGYKDFLVALNDPTHEEHLATLQWIGGSFDPEKFDTELATARMAEDRQA